MRINLLFIIPNFKTAGGGKVVYDLMQGIDRSKFQVFQSKLSNSLTRLNDDIQRQVFGPVDVKSDFRSYVLNNFAKSEFILNHENLYIQTIEN